MNIKKIARLRRAARGRRKIREQKIHRLVVHRTPQHIYAQLFAPSGAEVIACASTLESSIKSQCTNLKKVDSAIVVGKELAKRVTEKGIKKVAFDRSGYKYHGRVKALADAAREGGLEF